MATQLTKYKVFIASPGGLEVERKVFREILGEHYISDASARNCIFDPVGWEITLGGVGRPQQLINNDLSGCDYFVLMLAERWGSPTGKSGGYSSGTEEEFHMAMQCLAEIASPMRQIVVLFRSVDPKQLNDPGPQLSEVLKFKKQLEESKAILFETFDDIANFSNAIRRHLAKWTRDHEAGKAKETAPKTISKVSRKPSSVEAREIELDILTGLDDIKDPFFKKVEKLYNAGKLTEAEAEFVRAVMPRDNLRAFYQYGHFLTKQRRLSDALNIFQELQLLSLATGDKAWASSALIQISRVLRLQGEPGKSIESLRKAIFFKQEINDIKGEMFGHTLLGDLLLQTKKPVNALKSYEEALELVKNLALDAEEADLLFKIAKCKINVGNIEGAVRSSDDAALIYNKLKNTAGLKSIKLWKKSKKSQIEKI